MSIVRWPANWSRYASQAGGAGPYWRAAGRGEVACRSHRDRDVSLEGKLQGLQRHMALPERERTGSVAAANSDWPARLAERLGGSVQSLESSACFSLDSPHDGATSHGLHRFG